MRNNLVPILSAAGLALAACGDVSARSGPPVSGTTAGPGSSPLRQEARDIGGSNSGNASSGTPSFNGTQGTRPGIRYTDPGSGGVGSTAPPTLPTTGRSRSN
jgi:hypothetical protein